jgi:hypothetical protein
MNMYVGNEGVSCEAMVSSAMTYLMVFQIARGRSLRSRVVVSACELLSVEPELECHHL